MLTPAYAPELKLKPYDDRSMELGLSSWVLLQDFLREGQLSPTVQRNVLSTINATHREATSRFVDPSILQYEYERPLLYVAGTVDPYEGFYPDPDEQLDIAMDTLHGFVAVKAFKREYGTRDDHKSYVYYNRVGVHTRNAITGFVNAAVEAASK